MRDSFVGIAGWLKNSFIDYPRTVSTVLFYPGCNLRCPYCHNPGLVQGAHDMAPSAEEIRAFLKRRQGVIEGVVLSGGEPTLQPSLRTTAREVRRMGFAVKLDTNGLLPQIIEEVQPDYLALDIKTGPANYGCLLGATCSDVEERLSRSVAMVRQLGEMAEVRITVAPGMLDDQSLKWIASAVQGVHNLYLQPMQQRGELLNPAYAALQPVGRDELARIQVRLGQSVQRCRVRTDGHAARAPQWDTLPQYN
jgi:pyruvate formate lyase activating enzyme